MTREGKRKLFKKRYYWVILVIFLMLMLGSLLIFFFGIQKQIEEKVKNSALEDLGRDSGQIRSVMELSLSYLSASADYISDEENMEWDDCQKLLEVLQGAGLKRAGIANSAGVMYYSDGSSEDVSGQDYFQSAMQGQQTVSDPLGGETIGEAEVVFAVPIRSSGEIVGVLGGIYDVSGLSEMLFGEGYDGDGYVFVTNSRGEVVAHSCQEELAQLSREGIFASYERKGRSSDTAYLQEAFAGEQSGTLSTSWDGGEYLTAYGAVGFNGWMICCAVSDAVVRKQYGFITNSEIILFGVVLLWVALMLLTIRSITHRKEEQLIEVAQTDALTGLLNKESTEEKINEWLSMAERDSVQAFLMMDIDRFKEINDLYGHVLGDEVLRRIGTLLRSFFREGDLVGRIGGDEFVVLMKNIPSAQHALERAKQLSREMKKIQIKGMEPIRFTGSMGLAFYPVHGKTYLELYRCADEALYRVKRNGRDGCAMYEKLYTDFT